jgi:hypothetical protein
VGGGSDRHAGGAQQRAVFLGHCHQRSDPLSTSDKVDRHALGGQHQGLPDRAQVPGGQVTLLVQVRQASRV